MSDPTYDYECVSEDDSLCSDYNNNMSFSDDSNNNGSECNSDVIMNNYIDVNNLNSLLKVKKSDKNAVFNLLHINARSLKKNHDEILNLIHIAASPIMAIAISETWLNTTNQNYYQIAGYNFVSQPRIGKSGGGTGIFLQTHYNFSIRTDLCHNNEYIECLFIEISQTKKANIIIGCIYRPPNTDVSSFNLVINNILHSIAAEKSKLVLLAGDYNLNLLKSSEHAPTNEFVNCLFSFSYLPVVSKPTRITETSATLIDNIFVRSNKTLLKSAIIYCDIADHLPIIVCVESATSKHFSPRASSSQQGKGSCKGAPPEARRGFSGGPGSPRLFRACRMPFCCQEKTQGTCSGSSAPPISRRFRPSRSRAG